MNALFFVCALLMSLVAMSFASAPLLRDARASSRGFAYLPLLVVLAALLSAVGLYAVIGRPDVPASADTAHLSAAATPRTAAGSGDKKAASVSDLLAGLEQRLQENPDDAKGWLLLAKSYDHLGRDDAAAAAYDKAVALGISDIGLEARLK